MKNSVYDVVIIGAGPGGYVSAIRCAQLGLNVAVVERAHLGGVCLNWGCIPTKALLHSAELMHMLEHSEDIGVSVSGVTANLSKMVERSRAVSQKLSKGVQHLLKKNKVTHIVGHGAIKQAKKASTDPFTLTVTHEGAQQDVHARHVILATGARARVISGIERDPKTDAYPPYVWTAKEAMIPTQTPKSLVIIGSGAIGIEFASFYRSLGVDVSVVEMSDRILPVEDADISAHAQKAFEKRGIRFYTSHALDGIAASKTGATVTIKSVKDASHTVTLEAEKVLLAIGIVPNTENLGLQHTKIQQIKGHIDVDAVNETHEKGIYAIGDVVHGPWLAHKASHEGILVAEKIKGHAVKPIDRTAIPGCTYSAPQIASIGLSEENARAQAKTTGDDIKVGVFPFMGNGKALAMGAEDGLIKLIFSRKTGELLGAHMVGEGVTELIHSMALCKTLEATEESIMHTIFPHPTLSEMLHEAALASDKRAIHI